MLPLIQGLIVVGGLIIALGVHVFLSNKPTTEQAIETVIEEVVDTTTGVEIQPMEKTVDEVVDVFENKSNK